MTPGLSTPIACVRSALRLGPANLDPGSVGSVSSEPQRQALQKSIVERVGLMSGQRDWRKEFDAATRQWPVLQVRDPGRVLDVWLGSLPEFVNPVRLGHLFSEVRFRNRETTVAHAKVQVLLADVEKTFTYEEKSALAQHGGYLEGLFVDQAVMWLVWVRNAVRAVGSRALRVLQFCNAFDYLKSVSNDFKLLGVSGNFVGPFVEMNCLLGKDLGEVDWYEELSPRISVKKYASKMGCKLNEKEFELSLDKLLANELPGELTWPPADEFFASRWAHVKSGSHNAAVDHLVGVDTRSAEKRTRRVFAEAVSVPYLGLTPALKVASASKKKSEVGKLSRALQNVDTIAQAVQDYLMKPVEKAWRNASCLLQPTEGDQLTSYWAWARKMKKYKVMLDFEDFNSQHHLWMIKLILQKLTRGADCALVDWLMKSVDSSFVRIPAGADADVLVAEMSRESRAKCAEAERVLKLPPKSLVLVVGGLLTGDRITTIINTLCNWVYCDVLFDMTDLVNWHVGDDVLITTDDVWRFAEIVCMSLSDKVRISLSKCSYGEHVAEFLRVSFNSRQGRGYASRTIGNAVSGNWGNDKPLAKSEFLSTMVEASWTLNNRSHSLTAADAFGHAIARSLELPEQLGLSISRGEISVDMSPVRASFNVGSVPLLTTVTQEKDKGAKLGDRPSFATDEYLRRFVDWDLIREAQVPPAKLRHAMLACSYPDMEGTRRISRISSTRMPLTTVEVLAPYSVVVPDSTVERVAMLQKVAALSELDNASLLALFSKFARPGESVLPPPKAILVTDGMPFSSARAWSRGRLNAVNMICEFEMYS